LLIGRVTYHWNYLHSVLQSIFVSLVGECDDEGHIHIETATRVWNTLKSDDAQRAVLLAFAQSYVAHDSQKLNHLAWLLKSVGQLSTYRNDATHVPFTVPLEGSKKHLAPDFLAAEKGRAARLTTVGHRLLFKHLIYDLHWLGIFARKLFLYLTYPELEGQRGFPPLRDRPPLRAHQLVEKSPPAKNSHR
jgi:hypothetical protein